MHFFFCLNTLHLGLFLHGAHFMVLHGDKHNREGCPLLLSSVYYLLYKKIMFLYKKKIRTHLVLKQIHRW